MNDWGGSPAPNGGTNCPKCLVGYSNVAGGNDVMEGYQLVDDAEYDYDYESDYDSDGELAEHIFNKIENY